MTAGEVMQWLCLWCLPTLAIAAATAWLLNVPALRMERARLFLDALDLGVRLGRSPEQTVVEMSSTRDTSLGARFHLLAAWIKSGLRFSEALSRLPSLAPVHIRTMLEAGSEGGVFPGALRAARRGAKMPDAQMRAALSWQIIMLFILNPLILVTLPFILLKVFPTLTAVAQGIGGPPWAMRSLIGAMPYVFTIQITSILLLYFGAIFYIGGNRFTRWLEAGLFPISSWIALKVPWKRKRLHRDFSSMFALLLDAGLPETRALRLAAESTSNEIFQTRAAKALLELERGMPLPIALEQLDPPREFVWRLVNALRRKSNYTAALEGWFDALEAEADAQEQSAGDYLSTAMLIVNGLIIAWVVAAVMMTVYGISLGQIPN